MMLIKNRIPLKNHASCSYAKILHHVFILTICESLKSVICLSRAKGNLTTCMPVWLVQLKKLSPF